MKRKTIISIVLTLFILIGAAVVFNVLKSKKKSTISDKAKTIELRKVEVSSYAVSDVTNVIDVDGRASAFEKILLSAEVQGQLLSAGRQWRKGSAFNKGDLLFKVDNRDDIFALKAQKSLLLNAVTQIMPDLKFDYPEAFVRWKTYLDNFDIEGRVKPLPEFSSDKEKYYIGGRNILSQYYTIKSLETKLDNYNLYAPFNGVFLSVNVYPGSLVSPGVNLGQIMNTYNYEMAAPVAPEDLEYLKVGQSVKLYSSEGGAFTGKINRTSQQIDQATQSIPVYITISGKGLRDGMYLKGTINGASLNEVNVIPKNLLINNNQVYTYQDSIISLKTLDIVKISGPSAYVKGLSTADQVISSTINNLYAGQKVTL